MSDADRGYPANCPQATSRSRWISLLPGLCSMRPAFECGNGYPM